MCTCSHKGDCNRGECPCCNAAQCCWGCSAACEKGGKAGGVGRTVRGDEGGNGKEAAGGGAERVVKGKNSLREARERREREEKAKGKRKPIVRVDKADNGVVLPDEVAKVRVRVGSTVVLSACNHTKSSHDMFKLCQSFIAAGAGAVLISMWSLVDESTSALMVRVYRNLRVGKSLPEALRAAMLQLAGRALMPEGEEVDAWDNREIPFCMLPFSRPLHWAGLIVVGMSTRLPGRTPKAFDAWDSSALAALLHTPTLRRQGDYL